MSLHESTSLSWLAVNSSILSSVAEGDIAICNLFRRICVYIYAHVQEECTLSTVLMNCHQLQITCLLALQWNKVIPTMCCSALMWILRDLSKIAPAAHTAGLWSLGKDCTDDGIAEEMRIWCKSGASTSHSCNRASKLNSRRLLGLILRRIDTNPFFWQRCSHSRTTDWRRCLTA